MFCKRCQEEREEGSRYCCACGKLLPVPLRAPADTVVPQQGGSVSCPNCSAKSLPTSRFCRRCGIAFFIPDTPTGISPTCSSADIQSILKKACELRKNGELDQAVLLVKKVVEAEPRNVLSRELLGDLYMARGMSEEAAQEFDAAVSVVPDSLELRRKLAWARGEKVAETPARYVPGQLGPDPSSFESILKSEPKSWYMHPVFIIASVIATHTILNALFDISMAGSLIIWWTLTTTSLVIILRHVDDVDNILWGILSFIYGGPLGLAVWLAMRNACSRS